MTSEIPYKNTEENMKKNNNHLTGKIVTLIQLVLSLMLMMIMVDNGLVPMKYIILAGIGLGLTFAAAFGLQFLKSKWNIAGIVLSVLVSIVAIVGIIALFQLQRFMKEVGGAEYKTDNMIVVVRKEDAAKTLEDAENYSFGIQTSLDQENNQLMVKDMEKKLNRTLKTLTYSTIIEAGEALLDGKADAIIYNEAFTGILDEAIEGYSDQVRVLYQYGIQSKVEVPAKEEKEANDIEQPFNVYISGIDVEGAITTTSRSDVNIIMTVNPKTKKILLTTTPRDYYVQIPEVSGDAKDKLTHAGIYGVDASMRTLGKLYDIDMRYYAKVNFTSLIKIVDALGGVDVNSDYAFEALHGGYTFHEGINHLDGDAALAFCRERYSFEAGDNQRGKNQEIVLTAILNKAMSPAILKNATGILTRVSDSVETNMTDKEMAKFINMQLADNARWTIESVAATGTGDTLPCFSSGAQPLYVMHPDFTSVSSITEKMKEILSEK